MVLAISRLNTVIQIALMGFCVLSPLGSPVQCTPVHHHHPYRCSTLQFSIVPPNSRVPENGSRAAVLLPLSPGLAPPAELLPTPGQPRLDPVQAPHEDPLPVQVQSSPSQILREFFRDLHNYKNQPRPSLALDDLLSTLSMCGGHCYQV